MSKLQILSAQIQTDLNSLIEDVAHGLVTTEELIKAMSLITQKVKDWSAEADAVIGKTKIRQGDTKTDKDSQLFDVM